MPDGTATGRTGSLFGVAAAVAVALAAAGLRYRRTNNKGG